MNYEELEVAYCIAVAYEEATGGSDRQRAVEVFGGEQAAIYERLCRKAESTVDIEGADAANAGRERMERGLTPLQERRLFGIGEWPVLLPEAVQDYMKALAALDYDTPEALGASLAHPLLKLGRATDPAAMGYGQLIAFAQVRAALEHAIEMGWSYESVLAPSVRRIGNLYGDPDDAEYMSTHINSALGLQSGRTGSVAG
jgi:hypothetical protein